MSNIPLSLILPLVTVVFALIITACALTPAQTLQSNSSSPISPAITTITPPETAQSLPSATATDIYAYHDDFGDGFIARVPLTDTLTKEEIVNQLVTQWLDHYKFHSNNPQAAIDEYTVDTVSLMGSTAFYEIVAGVKFSIVTDQIPSAWGSFPGEEIKSGDRWWHLSAPFGVFRDGDNFRLRLVFGWGT